MVGILRVTNERRMAEGEGFEPPEPFPVQWFSRPPPSTTRPSLRVENRAHCDAGRPVCHCIARRNQAKWAESGRSSRHRRASVNLVSRQPSPHSRSARGPKSPQPTMKARWRSADYFVIDSLRGRPFTWTLANVRLRTLCNTSAFTTPLNVQSVTRTSETGERSYPLRKNTYLLF